MRSCTFDQTPTLLMGKTCRFLCVHIGCRENGDLISSWRVCCEQVKGFKAIGLWFHTLYHEKAMLMVKAETCVNASRSLTFIF